MIFTEIQSPLPMSTNYGGAIFRIFYILRDMCTLMRLESCLFWHFMMRIKTKIMGFQIGILSFWKQVVLIGHIILSAKWISIFVMQAFGTVVSTCLSL